MIRIAFTASLALAFLCPVHAEATLPLYDTFQSLCIKAEGSPEAFDKAAASLNAQHIEVDLSKVPSMAAGGKITMWKLSSAGRDYLLAGSKVIKEGSAPNFICSVVTQIPEEESLKALEAWVGVPSLAVTTMAEGRMSMYAYIQDGDRRTVMKPGQALLPSDGQQRMLVIGHFEKSSIALLLNISSKQAQ